MDSKTILGIAIGVVIGVAIGYAVYHEPMGAETVLENWPVVSCPPPPAAPVGTAQSLLLEIIAKANSDPTLDPLKRQHVIDLATRCLMLHAAGPNHQPTSWDPARQKVYNAWAATCDPSKPTPDWDVCIGELDHLE